MPEMHFLTKNIYFSRKECILPQFTTDQKKSNILHLITLLHFLNFLGIASAEDNKDLILKSNAGLHAFT